MAKEPKEPKEAKETAKETAKVAKAKVEALLVEICYIIVKSLPVADCYR